MSLLLIPSHYSQVTNSEDAAAYLKSVLTHCPKETRSLQIGSQTGYSAIWLSLRGVDSECIMEGETDVVKARHADCMLGGSARFRRQDFLELTRPGSEEDLLDRYSVIHHSGRLERHTASEVRALLAQQVVRADWVVFSVKSAYYSQEPGEGETLLPLEEWERLLAPFEVEHLDYYKNVCSNLGGGEHILCVLKGQACTDELRQLMSVGDKPYLPGISAIVHTRNEERHLAECLRTLQGWTDEIIVCDMESRDATLEIARQFTGNIVRHPLIANFDASRNVSAFRARHEWVFYLDADERVPPELGARLREIALRGDAQFDALHLPFRNYFAGRWMRSIYPGYKAANLYRNGCFHYNTRLHAGASVSGISATFPADDPDIAVEHYSFDSLSHYLDKLNRYTDGEALNMDRDSKTFHWQDAVAEFALDLSEYYNGRQAGVQDGVHGFIYSFLSAFYRFEQHAKLYERRFRDGRLEAHECALPRSASDILACALTVAQQLEARQNAAGQLPPVSDVHINPELVQDQKSIVWTGPLESPSGYGEESRHLLLALAQTSDAPVAAQTLRWGDNRQSNGINEAANKKLTPLMDKPVAPGFTQVLHTFGSQFGGFRHPLASYVIGRTIFETDRLPQEWVQACNEMDRIWVATEFNRQTFTASGVEESKIAVIPECIDPLPYRQKQPPPSMAHLSNGSASPKPYVFLSIFDWTLHKGWDVLLSSFVEEFCLSGDEAPREALLLLKVWSSQGYSQEGIRAQAQSFIRERYGIELAELSSIRFIDDYLQPCEIIGLYQASDCYVMPSRGEGWGRPYMEAMACGLPVIGTDWGGNTEFMRHEENSLLIRSRLVPIPEAGWQEVAYYKGHRWAEPDRTHLRELMRRVVDNPVEVRAIGYRAAEYIEQKLSYAAVGRLMADDLQRIGSLGEAAEKQNPRTIPADHEHSTQTSSKRHRKNPVSLEPQPQNKTQTLQGDRKNVVATAKG